jgi:hypothetical protein
VLARLIVLEEGGAARVVKFNLICGAILVICLSLGCSNDDAVCVSPGPEKPDSSEISLDVAPDRLSIVAFLRGRIDSALEYYLFRSENDSTDYRRIPGPPPSPGIWEDAAVTEGHTYYYKARGVNRGRFVGSSPAVSITVRFPRSVLRYIEESYNARSLCGLDSVFTEDFTFDGRAEPGRELLYNRVHDLWIHGRMFDSTSIRNRVTAISLDFGKASLRRLPEFDHTGMMCFELTVRADLLLTFDVSNSEMRSISYNAETVFHVRHDKEDWSRWVIYKWMDQ